MNPITKWLAAILAVICLMISVAFVAYDKGIEHQKGVYAAAQLEANAKVEQKNETSQSVADNTAKAQVIYKDRIVTKYQTITQEVVKYEKSEASNLYLDPEFVRLHNNAASANDATQIAQSASGSDAAPTPSGVTTGEAIAVITRNYERYQQCVRQVNGWNQFYKDLQNNVNH